MSDASISRRNSVAIATLGCKLNQFESEAILAQFRLAGFNIVDDIEAAEIGVMNTCAVTSNAERKGRSLLRAWHRRNPHAQLFAVGCMAERVPKVLATIEGVMGVFGNREKEHLFDFLPTDFKLTTAVIHVGETERADHFTAGTAVTGLLGRTRAFLKVQDGCSQKCTYCIIPQLRGQGRSLNITDAVKQAQRLSDQGFSEVVLTGVALGTFGDDQGHEHGLPDLLNALSKISGLRRIRLGSVEPWAITKHLIETIADSSVICPHLHIPLQSAENSILRRMNRRYTIERIKRILDYALHLRHDWGFGADIIVGFPGEGEEQFAATYSFLADSPFAYLHVFPYSARPATPALRLPDCVADDVKKNRVAALQKLDNELRANFRRAHLDTEQDVLFEKRYEGKLLAGHTRNYLDVYALTDESLAGTIQRVRITHLHPNGVVGKVLH